jgi:hypothetical protein
MSTTHFVRLKAASRCRLAPAFLLFLALDACGGGAGGGSSSGYTIGGDLSGLPSGGQEITLLNNGTDALTLVTNGPFTFSHEVPNGGNYNVTIKTQPAAGTCVVSNGSGTHSNANVTVTCSTNTYTVGGNLVGLASGQQVTLQNNGAALLTLTTDGTFSFSTQIPYAGTYSVTVSSQPSQASQQFCTVSNGSGTIYGAVTNVQVTCNTTLILYGFSSANSLTGGNPTGSLIMDAAGNLYGTTEGIVFELSPAVGGGYTGSVLYERPGVSGGVIMDSAGNLYGTSPNVVFKLTPSSGGGYSESDLHAFPGDTADGGGLAGALILDSGGNLYGTASSGGTNLAGIVFELSPSAGGGYNESILHSFTGGGDGANPTAGLVMDSTGNLYGTTTSGAVAAMAPCLSSHLPRAVAIPNRSSTVSATTAQRPRPA